MRIDVVVPTEKFMEIVEKKRSFLILPWRGLKPYDKLRLLELEVKGNQTRTTGYHCTVEITRVERGESRSPLKKSHCIVGFELCVQSE